MEERTSEDQVSHRHFCDFAGHWWECGGTALRLGDREPSVCTCLPCGLPLEGFDHSQCHGPAELVACPEHHDEQRRRMGGASQKHGRHGAGRDGADVTLMKAQEGEALAETMPPVQGPVTPFERFPLVPIGPDDPLWHCDSCCHCGCRRMPPELSGGFCFHCFHEYQRNDPEFWLGEEFAHSEAAHLKNCAHYQESSKKSEEGWAKFRAMTAGADEETFSKLLHACYSKAIDDNYQAYMSAPEGSPERAAIVERIVVANAQEIAESKREWDAVLGLRGR